MSVWFLYIQAEVLMNLPGLYRTSLQELVQWDFKKGALGWKFGLASTA